MTKEQKTRINAKAARCLPAPNGFHIDSLAGFLQEKNIGYSNRFIISFSEPPDKRRIFYTYLGDNEKMVLKVYSHVTEKKANTEEVITKVIALWRQNLDNIRIFLLWIHKKYYLPFDPKEITVPKPPKKLVRILSDSEVQILLNSVQTSSDWITARDRAIVAFLLDSGIPDLSVLMGHESSETTKRYEHYARDLVAAECHSSHLDRVFLNKNAES